MKEKSKIEILSVNNSNKKELIKKSLNFAKGFFQRVILSLQENEYLPDEEVKTNENEKVNMDLQEPNLGCIRKVGSYVQNGENNSRSSKEKKGLKRISSLIIAGSDTPEIFQAAKTALYYIPALVSLPVIFPGVKQILGRRDGVLGTLLSKEKSNFLCPIRPIAQNVAALDFSKLLQKRDGLIAVGAVTGSQQ